MCKVEKQGKLRNIILQIPNICLRFFLKSVEKLNLQHERVEWCENLVSQEFKWFFNCNIKLFRNNCNGLHLKIQKAYRNIVTSCLLGGPRKSLLTRCSRVHITTAIITKKAAVTHHISHVKGLRNTQAFDFELSIGATITSPVVA